MGGYAIIYYGMIFLAIIHIILAIFSCNIIYYLIDTIIIGIFLVTGNIDSWDLYSWIYITGYFVPYFFIRGIIVLIIFIIKIKQKNIRKISNYNTIFLLIINIILNLIAVNSITTQWLAASSV